MRFLQGKSQIIRAKFQQLTLAPETRKRKWRIGPAGDDQLQLRRLMLHQKRDGFMHIVMRDEMQIV
jgi:hypothetical protein